MARTGLITYTSDNGTFVDVGEKITTQDVNDKNVQAMVLVSYAKWGEKMEFTGSEAFKACAQRHLDNLIVQKSLERTIKEQERSPVQEIERKPTLRLPERKIDRGLER